MNNKLIVANWKMNCTVKDAENLVSSIAENTKNVNAKDVSVVVCTPFTLINLVGNNVKENSLISLGAQNCYHESKGAFTGEISPEMLKDLSVEYVILGHSERRSIFGESDNFIQQKVQAVFNADLSPIVCIGETLEEKQNGFTKEVILKQLSKSLPEEGVNTKKLVIAYEPVWAIGTSVTPTEEEIADVHKYIRKHLQSVYGEEGSSIKILYGGSLNDKNADSILPIENVDGALIGGASLQAESFVSIINTAVTLNK